MLFGAGPQSRGGSGASSFNAGNDVQQHEKQQQPKAISTRRSTRQSVCSPI